MGTTTVSVDSRGVIARLTVTRPERENAIDAAIVRDMRGACDGIAQDTRVVLLTGEGDVFSRGWDWEALLGETTDAVAGGGGGGGRG
jgi:enoyl-CoA hydratase/carnithine racemase